MLEGLSTPGTPHIFSPPVFWRSIRSRDKFVVSPGEVLAQLTEPELTLENKNLWQPDL